MLNFNKLQEEVINYEQQEMLVKGVAGSGKTLCLLLNALNKAYEDDGVYFFTYNKTLQKYISSMAENSDVENLSVATFHSWAFKELRKVYGNFTALFDDNKGKSVRLRLLDKSIANARYSYNGRFITNPEYKQFILEEIEFMNSQYIKDYEEYSKIVRSGRGNEVRLSQNDREEIYCIFENYQAEKFMKNYFEPSEWAARLLDNFEKVKNNSNLNYVYIDEAQDLDKAQLLLLRRLTNNTFYIAADKGQKIYRTSYSWKDIGVNVLGGRTKILNSSFRTTAEILRLAKCLQKKDSILSDEDYIEASFDEMRSGLTPEVIIYDSEHSNMQLIQEIKNSYTNDNKVSVGVLVEGWKDANRIKRVFDEGRIPYQEIKGENGSSITPGIKITTMHSSKGLEFDHVIIPEFKYENKLMGNEDADALNILRRLYYVSFTRARNKLTIIVPRRNPSRLFSELTRDLYTLK